MNYLTNQGGMYSIFPPESTQITRFVSDVNRYPIYQEIRNCADFMATFRLAGQDQKAYISCLLLHTGDRVEPHPTDADLSARFAAVQERVANAARKAGRAPEGITVVAVTKTHPVEVICKAHALGIREFGENRVQEAIEKIGSTGLSQSLRPFRLHLIGHLQRNKVHKALQVFDIIDSMDSLEIANLISSEAGQAGKTLRVLLEVNTSLEPQKYGVSPVECQALVSKIADMPNLQFAGLMTIGPNVEDGQTIRSSFRLLKQLFDEVQNRLHPPHWSVLSMGMSSDYELAIEEGATEIRLGSALFGQRS